MRAVGRHSPRYPGAQRACAVRSCRAGGIVHCAIWGWLTLQLFYTSQYTPSHQVSFVINVTPDRMALLAVLLLFGWRVLADRRSLLPASSTEAMMVALSVYALASLIASGANVDTSHGQNAWLSSVFSFLFVPYAAYYMARNLNFGEGAIRRYLFFFFLMGLYLGLTAICEVFKWNSLVVPAYIMDPDVGIHFGRARGPVLNSGFLGQLLIFCLFCTLLLARFSRGAARGLYLAGGLAMLAGIYFTYTRGPWLALAAGLLVLLLSPSKLRRYALACCCLISAVGLFSVVTTHTLAASSLVSERKATIYDRVNIMAASLRLIAANPALGVGYGKFEENYQRYWGRVGYVPLRGRGSSSHNTPLGLAAELGLPALLCYAFIFYRLAKAGLAACTASSPPFLRELGLTFMACLVSYLVSMQTLDIKWCMVQNVTLFLLAGLLVSATSRIGLTGLNSQPGPRSAWGWRAAAGGASGATSGAKSLRAPAS